MKRVLLVLTTTFLILCTPLTGMASPTDGFVPLSTSEEIIIQPLTIMSCAVTLSKYSSSELQFASRCMTTSTGNCYVKVTLQRKVNGSFQDYGTYTSSGSGQYISFNKRISPPKGYTYRAKATFTTTYASTCYSDSLSW